MARQFLYAASGIIAAASLGLILTATRVHTEEFTGVAPAGTPIMSGDEFEKMYKEVSNWGRWGKDDRLGALNLITEDTRKRAIRLAKLGISVSIEHDISTQAAPDNPTPFELKMGEVPRLDTWATRYHGTYVTHIDALCHYHYKNLLYNGVPLSASNDKGCAIGVELMKKGVITRGVLLDIPRLKGVPYLDPGTTVSIADVEAWEKKAGVKIGPGDAVILRTGRWLRREKLGPWKVQGNAAGFHASVARLLRQRDVTLVAADATAEAQNTPAIVLGVGDMAGHQPLHTTLISSMGVILIDDADPEALAEMCAKLNRWDFMFVTLPIAVPGGTGGPVNPVAIF